jgi:hypothetical protein
MVVVASLLGAAWTLWERQRQDPWLRLYHQATRRLQQAGLVLPAQAPPRQMATLLQAHHSFDHNDIATLSDWLLRLEAWRYSAPGAAQRPTLDALQREFRQLQWPKGVPIQAWNTTQTPNNA